MCAGHAFLVTRALILTRAWSEVDLSRMEELEARAGAAAPLEDRLHRAVIAPDPYATHGIREQ